MIDISGKPKFIPVDEMDFEIYDEDFFQNEEQKESSIVNSDDSDNEQI